MALHRDIFWVGRQWAVTGYGIQACDQKLTGKFDIEVARLWDEDKLNRIRAESWINLVDFEKAVLVARKYYPEQLRHAPSPETGVLNLIDQVLKDTSLRDSILNLKSASRGDTSQRGAADPHRPDPGGNAAGPEDIVLRDRVAKDISVKLTATRDAARKDADLTDGRADGGAILAGGPIDARFDMRISGWPAKFVRQWRVRIGR